LSSRASVDTSAVVDRLAGLPDLAGIPRDQLEWLVGHGEVHRYDDGRRLSGEEFDGLVVVISGRFAVRVSQHGVEREMREITPGRVSGFLPYSRMTTPRGYLVADGPVEFLAIRQQDFREMTRECYEFTAACVQEMLARVRVFKADDKHQEKMAALGRLSAGLAHELNNPASAAVSGAGELEACRLKVASASRTLGATALDEQSRLVLQSLEAAAQRARTGPLTPMDRANLEDRIADWVERHGVDPAVADPLSETGLSVEDLDAAASALDPAHVPVLVEYVAANAAARGLAADLLSAAARIHSLVAAVKTHTHMDRAPGIEAIELEDHLADTATLLSSKAALKTISMDLTVEADLPTILGSVADLNQAWMHLIDNAIDAAPEAGRVAIEAKRGQGTVVVTVVDNGPGIPDENRERVFEPFFTTKDVGQGRGLGLDIVRTVVQTHRGAVDLISRPGRTEFRVTLPAAVALAEPAMGEPAMGSG
jgi:signal transduction histidine kinase